MKSDEIFEYKFKAKLGNIYDGSMVRTVECKAKSLAGAIDKFNDKLYKTIGDMILSIERVGYVVATIKEISIVEKDI